MVGVFGVVTHGVRVADVCVRVAAHQHNSNIMFTHRKYPEIPGFGTSKSPLLDHLDHPITGGAIFHVLEGILATPESRH